MIGEYVKRKYLYKYTDSSFVVQQKAYVLLIIHLIMLPVSIIYLFINIYRLYVKFTPGMAGIIAIDAVFIAMTAAGILLIKSGRFNIAGFIDISLCTCITVAGQIFKSGIQIETGFNNFSPLMFALIILSAMFGSRRMLARIFVILLFTTILLHWYSAGFIDPSLSYYLLSGTLNNIITLVMITSLAYYNMDITDGALEIAQNELRINRELSRSLEKKVEERTEKLAEESAKLNARNAELEEIRSILTLRNEELEVAKKTAEDANSAKNRFLANLSHELRTPLNGIIGISDLMMGRELSDEEIQMMRMIKRSGENLSYIIQDLLDFTLIENSQITLKEGEVNLRELIAQVKLIVSDSIQNKNLSFDVSLDPCDAVVISDRTRLFQIIINLIMNSLKYTRSGGIELAVRSGEQLIIEVSDTGIGIEQDKLEMIFEPFSRSDSDYVKSQSGLGLGLAIINQIIKIMNGSISVASEPGRGSVFTVTLPALPVKGELNSMETADERDYTILSDKKILLVEDNAVNMFYFKSVLEKNGAIADEASNGIDALRKADSSLYDIILMDLSIPDLDGLMLTRMIRNTDNPNRETLITALSAHAYKDHITLCMEAGMDNFIAKPVDLAGFLTVISNMLKNKDKSAERFNSKTDFPVEI